MVKEVLIGCDELTHLLGSPDGPCGPGAIRPQSRDASWRRSLSVSPCGTRPPDEQASGWTGKELLMNLLRYSLCPWLCRFSVIFWAQPMNTPKKPKRGMRTKELLEAVANGPEWSHITAGIHDRSIAKQFADAITQWPWTEEAMVSVLASLLDSREEIASELFHSIATQNVRLPIFYALLENTQINKKKPSDYDDILAEFDRLNSERNKFVHWYWFTDMDTGKVYLSRARRGVSAAVFNGLEIPSDRIKKFVSDCRALDQRIRNLVADKYKY